MFRTIKQSHSIIQRRELVTMAEQIEVSPLEEPEAERPDGEQPKKPLEEGAEPATEQPDDEEPPQTHTEGGAEPAEEQRDEEQPQTPTEGGAEPVDVQPDEEQPKKPLEEGVEPAADQPDGEQPQTPIEGDAEPAAEQSGGEQTNNSTKGDTEPVAEPAAEQPDAGVQPKKPTEGGVAPTAEPAAVRPDGEPPKKPLLTTIREEWHRFHTFVWNSEKKEFIGRTGKSCAQITLFYICFYTCLAGFWAAMFAIFYQTVSLERPKYTSLITPPGLNVMPYSVDGKLIQYGTTEDRARIKEEIQKNVLDVLARDQSTFEDCENLPPVLKIANPPEQRLCHYDASQLGPCATNDSFDTNQPCLYMGLNKLWGWIPENYESGPPVELTEIRNKLKLNGTTEDRIAVTCIKCDRNNSTNCSPLDVYPRDGISFGHYPYVVGTDTAKQARYIRPIVAAKVPLDAVGKEYRVSCRAWAGNLNEVVGGLFDSRVEPARFSIRIMVTE
ncbi:sodium/potassium-transporting ATPase subunit beta-1-like isoform X2 [Asterias rubens]|uniref:sodium/potassium-transporting ATPase subunit beta-1-like isoform X2 n=1 Tax=Asterias rubens TaxID=7604 RepID=UPI0014556FB9|nr:sodium/potassium-transporting ATPase subunit beta-1-like isoform X2 [Asterias rubens]